MSLRPCLVLLVVTTTFSASAVHAKPGALDPETRVMDGAWAVRIDVPVAWESNTGIRNGQGTITQWARATRAWNGDIAEEHLQVCGVELPDYTNRLGAKHGTVFPSKMFDHNRLPPVRSVSHFEGFDVGDAFKTEPTAFLMGLTLPRAAQAPWPARSDALPNVIDHDGDGYPGITLWAKSVEGYSYPPASMLPFSAYGVRKFHVALRSIVGIRARLTAVDRAEGSAHIPVIDDRLAMTSHIVGCELVSGKACSASQAEFLDKMQPQYKLAGTPRVILSKVDDQADCHAVRMALADPK